MPNTPAIPSLNARNSPFNETPSKPTDPTLVADAAFAVIGIKALATTIFVVGGAITFGEEASKSLEVVDESKLDGVELII